MKWINVNEELPEEGVDVLVYWHNSESMYVDFRMKNEDDEYWYWSENPSMEISHWMKLPEPPSK